MCFFYRIQMLFSPIILSQKLQQQKHLPSFEQKGNIEKIHLETNYPLGN